MFEAASDVDNRYCQVELVLPKYFGPLFLFTGSEIPTRPIANALGEHK